MKRFITLMLAVLMSLSMLTACGGDSPAAEPTPEPTPTPRMYFPNPFTGEAKTANYPDGQRAVAVMVNNISACRPQSGLSQASILVETKVEGGITRFVALFEDYKNLDDVGPVRSGRDQFWQLVMPYDVLYCHIGRSAITQTYIDTFEYNDRDLDGNSLSFIYRRNRPGKATEHTAYTNAELLQEAIDKGGYDMNFTYDEPIWDFVDYDIVPGGKRELNGSEPGPADQIQIVHSQAYRTYFQYDKASGKWLMSQYNGTKGVVEPTVDENNGKQLAFDNVFVLVADITTYPYPGGNPKGDPNYQKLDLSYGDKGIYFSGEGYERIRWFKGGAPDALRFTDRDEKPIEINCGKTYIAFVDSDEWDKFKWAYTPAGESIEVDTSSIGVVAESESEFE